MSEGFRALRVAADTSVARLETLTARPLGPDEVAIRVHFSSLNYKDALAVTGRGKILRQLPLTPGIDAAGVVVESNGKDVRVGSAVLVTGGGIGETTDGGYAEILRVRADHVIPLPAGLSLREAMILGTAGFTAALALHRMTHNGQSPDLGPILITGASGGVGSFATQIFARAGFEVHAVSGKPERFDYLRELGAARVLAPADLGLGARPLESVRYGGAVDNVGGETLARVLAHVQPWGNVAAVGLALAPELHASVLPFILRGISLLGVSSTNAPGPLRRQIWRRLSGPWRPRTLDGLVTKIIRLEDVVASATDMLERRTFGRILVEVT